jgi:protocatechuate 3,4-dioxygenase beta subunit
MRIMTAKKGYDPFFWGEGPAWLALLGVLFTGAASAQGVIGDSIRVQGAQSASKPGTSVIRGRVSAGDTGKPLRRARVTLRSLEPNVQGQTVTTGTDGRFELTDLPASRYTVSAARSGYLTLSYGQTRPLEAGKPLQVLDNQIVENLTFTLPRMSVVGGRITDENGEPMPGMRVLILRPTHAEGQRRLVVAGDGSTDDAGRYRIEDVVPGAYFVFASLRQTWTIIEDDVEQVIGYAPTYYPGTTSVANAQRLTIGVGQDVSTADFALVRGRAASASGTAIDSHGLPLAGQTVYLAQEFRGGGSTSTFQLGGPAMIGADGKFTVKDLPPGDYKLTIRDVTGTGTATHVEEAGTARFSVNGADVGDLRIASSRGWSASGQVLGDRGPIPDTLRPRITIVGRPVTEDADLKVGGIDGSGEVRDDGTFVLAGLFGGQRLRANLPAGWMVKSVLRDNRDVTDEPLEFRSGQQLMGVQLILTDRMTTVTGRVTDDKNAPIAEGTVLVFHRDAEKWADAQRYLRTVRPDQDGQFDIRALPPGEYLAVAVGYVQDGQWNDPEYLESLRRYGQRVRIDEGGTQTISLKIVSP